MLYELSLSYQGGSYHAILKDITVENGYVHGTQVGVFDGWDENRNLAFTACEPRDYFAGGGAFTLTEYKGELQ